VFNPIAAVTLSKYEQLENKYLKGQSSLLAVSPAGVWLRQTDAYGQSVVHARYVAPRDMEMKDFIIFLYDTQNRFVGRIDAAQARLENGYWHLRDAWITGPDRPARHEDEYLVRTDLTVAKIQESFATPASISFWEMPHFIRLLENAGFSGLRHRIYWYAQLADPALLCAMVLFSAVFTLRMNLRRGAPLLMIGGGLATGFSLYFLSDVVFALGASASVPMMLAAWSPAGASLLVGTSMLLYTEEG
jgi:lipopolysaccharide export system permease protein